MESKPTKIFDDLTCPNVQSGVMADAGLAPFGHMPGSAAEERKRGLKINRRICVMGESRDRRVVIE